MRSMKDYSKESYVDMLKELDWSTIYQERDVDIALEKFNTMITQVMDDVAPEKEIRIKGSTEPWIDAEVLELIRERDRALFISNRNKSNPYLKSKYKDLRNKAVKLNRQKKSIHFCNKVEEHKDNPKKLWKQFKTLGYSNKNVEKSGIVLEIDNEKCFDPLKVVSEI
ncbi:unnamed protein product, partial [Meganyctiphanes norvegica]